jgi:nitronate monooxygenase
MNALIEASSRHYHERMVEWVSVALEEGIRFFVTSLGNPRWVCERVHAAGGPVYHDVTERKWALKGRDAGADGLIAVNARAGGHAGPKSAEALYAELADLGLPLVCAGGIGDAPDFVSALRMGYAGVQMGTRFIATPECLASAVYKQAILDAEEADIVLSERITGVPVAVINTPYIQRMGLKAGWLARRMLRGHKTKHWMRMLYGLKSIWQLKRSSLDESGEKDYWQAGRSVSGITSIEPSAEIVRRFRDAALRAASVPAGSR